MVSSKKEDIEINKNIWNISLNIPSNTTKNVKMIGKNITFSGNSKYYYQYNNITIIGHGRIYNEYDLWTKILKMSIPLIKIHPLLIVIELYRIFGIEKTIEYLDGDYSFVLFDMNIYGDESLIYVVKDAFGLCPLYQWINKNSINHSSSEKKVQFYDSITETNQNQYMFSSCNNISPSENMILENITNGTYLQFTHSFKVSAIWKFKHSYQYYTLPFYTTYMDENNIIETDIKKHIITAVNKRIHYILHYENAFFIENYLYNGVKTNIDKEESYTEVKDYVDYEKLNTPTKPIFYASEEAKILKNEMIHEYMELNKKIKIGIIDYDKQNKLSGDLFEFLKTTEEKYDYKIEYVCINFIDKNILELEEKYPNIIQTLKTELNNKNDPSIIRAYFVPLMIAKHISETEPDIKYVFMGEPFIYKWIFTNVFDRREDLNDAFFLENIKGWIGAFFEYNIELIIPYLDRILVQKI